MKGKCCICGAPIEGFGNNPEGAVWKDGSGRIIEAEFAPNNRCCDLCDSRYVIPGRIYRMNLARKKRGEKS